MEIYDEVYHEDFACISSHQGFFVYHLRRALSAHLFHIPISKPFTEGFTMIFKTMM